MACSSRPTGSRRERSGSSADTNADASDGGSPRTSATPASSRCRTVISGLEPKTGRPVAANANADTNDHQSVSSSGSAPSTTSGAMKPGVPITSPVRVT